MICFHFLPLPNTDKYCVAVHIAKGLWAHCQLCDKHIPTKSSELYTVGQWNQHVKSDMAHQKKIIALLYQKDLDKREKAQDPTLPEKEHHRSLDKMEPLQRPLITK